MEWKLLAISFLWLPYLCLSSSIPFDPVSTWLSKFLTDHSPNSKLLLTFGNFFEDQTNLSRELWMDKLERLISSPELISNSGGINNIQLSRNQTSFVTYNRPLKSFGEVIQNIILVLPEGIPSYQQDWILNRRLNQPLLYPLALRNADKFFVITQPSKIHTLHKSRFIRMLKYKVILTEENNGKDACLRQFCIHCPNPESMIVMPLENIQDSVETSQASPSIINGVSLFPDFQRNYYGFILRVSSTDKMEGDLEFAVEEGTGKTYAKRGVFASAMYHLAEGLNFTAELYRSSAGASTGHRVKNGTWVGSVGDVYNGDASFCMLCGMSFSRHSIVEICSPVTYEYIRFAIGPSEKLYTWQAIFWPFDGQLWFCFILTTFLTTLCSFCMLRWIRNGSHWGILKISQYFGRIFIEQSDDLPETLPQSLKIVVGFWLLFALVGTTIYRAKMVTFMTFPVFEHVPDTYDELIKSNFEIQFHYFPNIAYNAFKSSTNPIIMKVFQRMLKEPDPIKCLQRTLDTKSVCIMFTSVHEDLLNRNLSDRFGISPIRSSSQYAFMFTPGISSQKRADFTPNFRKILQTSLQMGLNEWWARSDAYYLLKQKNAWIKSIPPEGNHTEFKLNVGDSDDVLHLKHLKGAYTVLISGLMFSLISFILELTLESATKLYFRHMKSRRKSVIIVDQSNN